MFNKEEVIKQFTSTRIDSILREAERLDIKFINHSCGEVEASWKEVKLKGYISFERRAPDYSKWCRPRVTLRLWAYTYNKQIAEYQYFSFEGKHILRPYRRHRFGGEALAIVFGNKRMMTYNRLMAATLNCVGK